jgi:hypothetical protein
VGWDFNLVGKGGHGHGHGGAFDKLILLDRYPMSTACMHCGREYCEKGGALEVMSLAEGLLLR